MPFTAKKNEKCSQHTMFSSSSCPPAHKQMHTDCGVAQLPCFHNKVYRKVWGNSIQWPKNNAKKTINQTEYKQEHKTPGNGEQTIYRSSIVIHPWGYVGPCWATSATVMGIKQGAYAKCKIARNCISFRFSELK